MRKKEGISRLLVVKKENSQDAIKEMLELKVNIITSGLRKKYFILNEIKFKKG
jgi:hypothetical protein